MTSEEKKSLKEANLADRMKQYDYKVINECTNDWKVIVQTALDSYVIKK